MAEYTKEDFDEFAAAVLSAFEQVNHHLQMLVWAQTGGRGQKPARPGEQPSESQIRSFDGRVVYNINTGSTDEALRELKKRQQPGGAGAA